MATSQRVLKGAAVFADRLRRPSRGAVVLIYHQVGGGTASEIDLPAELFRDQMRMLADSGRVCSLDALVGAVDAGDTARINDAIVLTFDDGTIDYLDHAVPTMAEFGLPSTVFVATQFVDEQRPFWRGARPVSWRGLADAQSTGLVVVGSHTHSHALLDRLAGDRIADELDRSIDLIAEHLGARPAHFAYPKALAPQPAADAAVRARFRTASIARTRANVAGAIDLHRLFRSPVQRSDQPRHVQAKLAGGMRLEDDVRRLAARVRLRGATS